MKTVELFDTAIRNTIVHIDQSTYDAINGLANNPDAALLTGTALVATPLIGLSLKTLDKENTFAISSISRALGSGIFLGSITASFVATAGFIITASDDLVTNYEHYHQAYLTAFEEILPNLLPGLGYGLVVAVVAFVLSRTVYTKVLSKLESKLRWSTELPSGTPGEADINKLRLDAINSSKVKRFIKRARSKKSLLLGFKPNGKPIYATLTKVLSGSWQTSGESGAGKGVFNQLLFNQLIDFGHINIVFNPKPDEYASSALSLACDEANVPFYRLNLLSGKPCINPLAGCSPEETFEVLSSGCGLEETAQASDYYASRDRATLREVISSTESSNISDLLDNATPFFREHGRETSGLENKLTELALLPATQTSDDGGLFEVFEKGGCILIEGSPNNETALMLMKMLFVRVIQMTSNRNDKSVPVNLWIDECKYLLCPSIINALGTARDKNCRLFLTNQSNADFEAVSMQFPSSAIREIVIDNTPYKANYATRNRATAQSISEHCGTKDGIAASSATSVNELGTETQNGERRVTLVEEPIFHPNLIQNLPRGIAILSGIVDWPTLAIIPTLEVQKRDVSFHEAIPLARKDRLATVKESLL